MLNPALLAARYAGRPVLIRGQDLAQYAAQLTSWAPSSRGGGLGGLLSWVRGQRQDEPAAAPAPKAYMPTWLGEAEASGHRWCFKDGVALIEVEGPLLPKGGWCWGTWVEGYDTLMETVCSALADERVRALWIKHCSPGGVVSPGLPDLARILRESRALAGGKPIWGYADLCASADYWLASSGDRLIGSPMSSIGSIGCYMTHCDMSGALEKDGFVVTEIQFGDKKTWGSPYKPLSEEALAAFQAEVNEIGGAFVADVVAGRPNLTPDAVIATQGGCFLGKNSDPAFSALDLGLCDELMSEADAFAALVEAVRPPKTSAAPAATASAQENDMKRTAISAALAAAGLSAAQIKAVEAELDKVDCAEGEGDGEGEGGGEGGDMPPGEMPPEDGETVDAKVAQGILALPEAKGREGLAQKLAFQPGMTIDNAKGLLAAAPKASTLGERMAGQDPKVAAGGGQATPKAQRSTADIYQANLEAGRKARSGGR